MSTLYDVCAHGGHWCRRCQRYVVPVDDDHGRGRRCPRCDGISLRWDPPLPGFQPKAQLTSASESK